MWTKENTMFLVNLYQQYPQLYDPTHILYKNKTKRRLYLCQIAEEINKTFNTKATFETIAKKINGLRSTFMHEMNKIKKSKQSGSATVEIYEPSWWCFELLLFLNDITSESQGESNLTISENTSEIDGETLALEFVKEETGKNFPKIIYDGDVENLEKCSPPLLNIGKPNLSNKLHNNQPEIEKPQLENEKTNLFNTSHDHMQPKKKIKSNETDSFNNVNKTLEIIKHSEGKECDHIEKFSQLVEAELRLINNKNKLIRLKAAIMNLIYDAQGDSS